MSSEFVWGEPSNHGDFWRHGSDVQWRWRDLAAEVVSSAGDVLEVCERHRVPRQFAVAGGTSESEGLGARGAGFAVTGFRPQLIGLDERVEDREQLAHRGGQGHFLGFPFGQ